MEKENQKIKNVKLCRQHQSGLRECRALLLQDATYKRKYFIFQYRSTETHKSDGGGLRRRRVRGPPSWGAPGPPQYKVPHGAWHRYRLERHGEDLELYLLQGTILRKVFIRFMWAPSQFWRPIKLVFRTKLIQNNFSRIKCSLIFRTNFPRLLKSIQYCWLRRRWIPVGIERKRPKCSLRVLMCRPCLCPCKLCLACEYKKIINKARHRRNI